jgi:2-methylisocitrate lyase-like PEP mutase family enzyme
MNHFAQEQALAAGSKLVNQAAAAARFRALHAERPLVLPNAWDVGSARIMERAGALAVATTSAGVSWSQGCADGERLTAEDMVSLAGRLTQAVDVPVTADIESGYGDGSAAQVASVVGRLVGVGVAGINLEDSGAEGAPLVEVERQQERLRAARAAAASTGCDLFVNARIDTYLFAVGDVGDRLEATVRRAAAYCEAGADGIFVPGVTDAETIAELIAAIDAPLNIMAGPGAPAIDQLAALGVARVSVGPAIALAALAATERAARELFDRGSYEQLRDGLAFAETNSFFADGGASA